jgi:hypothetical protein
MAIQQRRQGRCKTREGRSTLMAIAPPFNPLSPTDRHTSQTMDELQVLHLASRGWRLFPVRARRKEPLIGRWNERATQDLETIRGWRKDYPDCNWAVACGPDSGLWVLDVDGREVGGQCVISTF